MSPLDDILDRARETSRQVVFPESSDPRVLQAASRLERERIVRPVLLGTPASIEAAAQQAGVATAGLSIVDPSQDARRAAVLQAAATALGQGYGDQALADLLRDPMYYAAAMVRAGTVDGAVAGAVHPTADTLRAALRLVRPTNESGLVSSFFLMGLREPTESGEHVLAFADCGLVPEPSAGQLAEIGRQTATNFARLVHDRPRVAFLSFSTRGSAEHSSIDRVRNAARMLHLEAHGWDVDGELQLDAALIPQVARGKAPDSPVAGAANVLIFPDLASGNIGYKLVERLAGARAIGPLLQGLRRPFNDLSRGCSVDDIVIAAAVTALQADGTD